MKKGFTLIEFLIALAITSFIFIISTSLIVNLSKYTTKSKHSEDIAHTKNQLESEFIKSLKWAEESIVYDNGALYVDGVKYYLLDGVFYRNSEPLTGENIVVESFEVTKNLESSFATGFLSGEGLLGRYYNADNLTNIFLERVDAGIDFDWENDPPVQGMSKDRFSVVWNGLVESVLSGNYEFIIESDDGVRLYVDDRLLIDKWTNGAKNESGSIVLDSNSRYSINVEYFDNKDAAYISLYWIPPGGEQEPIPVNNLYSQPTQSNIEININLSYVDTNISDSLHLVVSPRKSQIVGDIPLTIPNPSITRRPTREPTRNPLTPRPTRRPTRPPLR